MGIFCLFFILFVFVMISFFFFLYTCSNWDSLCTEHALQHTRLDWCSSDRTQHIDPLSITAIWGSLPYSAFILEKMWLSLHVILGTIYVKTIRASFCVVVGQVRKLEFLIAFLVFTIAACFMAELGYAKPDAKEVIKGLFVPELKGNGATGLAISLLGAMVMPWVLHVLFYHLIFLFF